MNRTRWFMFRVDPSMMPARSDPNRSLTNSMKQSACSAVKEGNWTLRSRF